MVAVIFSSWVARIKVSERASRVWWKKIFISSTGMSLVHRSILRDSRLALSQTDRKAEAPAELEKAIGLSGGDAFTYAILAKIYNENKMYQKAATTAQKGLGLNGGEIAFLNYQWGEALSKLGDYEGAITKFEKAASMKDPVWSGHATKQIDRQLKLIKIREAKKEQEQYE